MAILQNEYPYTSFQKINLDWVLDLCNKLKSDAENGVFNGERGYSVLGGENVRIIPAIIEGTTEPYSVALAQVPYAQVGDFVIGKYQNVLSIMLITRVDISGTVFIGDSVTSLQGPQGIPGPQGPQGEPGEGGLTEAMKQALLQMARKVAYIDGNGQTYYNALYTAFYGGTPVVVLESISAVFNQDTATIYDTDSLDTLKQYLTVTATYSDNTTATVTDYTLSGTLTEGTSAITVSYGGKTTTFNVTVMHSNLLYKWDFTKSLVDEVQSAVTTLLGKVEITSNGLNFNSSISSNKTGASAYLGNINMTGKTIEIDIASMEFVGATNKHVRLLMNAGSDTDTSNQNGFGSLIYRSTTQIGWTAYGYSSASGTSKAWAGSLWNNSLGINSFSGKTVKVVYGDDGHTATLYVDDVQMGVITNIYFNAPRCDYLYIGGTSNALQDYGDQLFNAVISGIRIYPNIS